MNDGHTTEGLKAILAQHYGGETYYRYPLGPMRYTEGVKAFADSAGGGAYWLLDIIGTEPSIRDVAMNTGFACMTLVVDGSSKAHMTVVGDEGIPPVYENHIPFTSCPEGTWKMFLVPTEDEQGKMVFMCMLPSEY